MADGDVHFEVEMLLHEHGIRHADITAVHSTSWRPDGPAVVLTYMAVIKAAGPVRERWPGAQPVTGEAGGGRRQAAHPCGDPSRRCPATLTCFSTASATCTISAQTDATNAGRQWVSCGDGTWHAVRGRSSAGTCPSMAGPSPGRVAERTPRAPSACYRGAVYSGALQMLRWTKVAAGVAAPLAQGRETRMTRSSPDAIVARIPPVVKD